MEGAALLFYGEGAGEEERVADPTAEPSRRAKPADPPQGGWSATRCGTLQGAGTGKGQRPPENGQKESGSAETGCRGEIR